MYESDGVALVNWIYKLIGRNNSKEQPIESHQRFVADMYSVALNHAGEQTVATDDLRKKIYAELRKEAESAESLKHPILQGASELTLCLGVIQLAYRQEDKRFYNPENEGFGINSITENGSSGHHPFISNTNLEYVNGFGKNTLISVPMEQEHFNRLKHKEFLDIARSAAREQGILEISDKELWERANIATEIGHINHPATGLQAVAAIDQDTNQLIIGVAGMNGEKLDGVDAIYSLGARQADILYDEALHTVVSFENKQREIVLAGHSLGGSVVQHVGYKLKNPTQSTSMLDLSIVTFDAPAISWGIRDYDSQRMPSDKVLNIAFEGSVVAAWGTQLGGSHVGGTVHYVRPAFNGGMDVNIRNHSIDALMSSIAYHVQTGELPKTIVQETPREAVSQNKTVAREIVPEMEGPEFA